MEVDLLIKNAKIVTETAVVDGCLAIRGEKIAAISNNDETFAAANLVDAHGNYLFPGAIDTHSHFFEPGDNYREDFAHGTQAAASGGFTLVLDMPNTNPPVKNEETFFLKYHAAVENCLVDFGLWGSSMADNLKNIGKLHELGCIGFKAFTIDAGPHFDYSGDYAQMKGMETVKNIGGIFGAHAENRDIIRHATELWTGNPWTPAIHDAARPWYAELSAINSLLLYAKITGCRLHICHLSIPEGAELIDPTGCRERPARWPFFAGGKYIFAVRHRHYGGKRMDGY